MSKHKRFEPLVVQLPQHKRRAIELFEKDSPFKQKIVPSKLDYQRHKKHRNRPDEE